MTEANIKTLLQKGEGLTAEFKSSFNNEVIETLVAFSNTSGGTVLIGITNDRKIQGVTVNAESVQNWLNEIRSKTSPQLVPIGEIVNCKGKMVVVFTVPEYPIKPVSTRSRYFKRVANSNHLMNTDEIAAEHLRTINSSWDYYIDPEHRIETISVEKVQKFIQRIEKQTGKIIEGDPIDFLRKLEIIRRNKLTFGGYLLFVKDYCLASDLQAGRFKGETKIIDSISLNTDLFSETDEIFSFIKKHLMVEYIITGEPQRTERFDYPFDAIREIVINMVVHRDYRDSSASIIKIFDDRIEFFNPGRLYGGITLKDLLSGSYISQCRNKLIAMAFKEAGLIERYGSGIQRIMRICNDYGIIPPVFEELFNGFKVTLFKKKVNVTEGVTESVTEGVTESRAEFILKLIRQMPYLKADDLAAKLKVTRRTIYRDIEKLSRQGKIRRIGSDKFGYWEPVE